MLKVSQQLFGVGPASNSHLLSRALNSVLSATWTHGTGYSLAVVQPDTLCPMCQKLITLFIQELVYARSTATAMPALEVPKATTVEDKPMVAADASMTAATLP